MWYEVEEIKELCDHCLGRIFAQKGHGLTNEKRGMTIRTIYAMENGLDLKELYPKTCIICENMFENVEKYAELALGEISRYEFSSFLIGSSVDKKIIENDKAITEKYGNIGERITNELDREIGKIISSKTGKEVSLSDPDIIAIIDTKTDSVRLIVKSVFIYGRYKKLERGIPQNRWIKLEGPPSIEEMVGSICNESFHGSSYVLHGEGREDVDVKMLGNGRPFVIEIKNPLIREADLAKIENEINEKFSGKIEVRLIRYATKKDVVSIKAKRSKKKYLLTLSIIGSHTKEEVERILSQFNGKTIRQRTPLRILGNKRDRVRERKVYEVKIIEYKENEIKVELETESGLYVKELVSGDNGRTEPNFAESLNGVKLKSLDVIEIETDDE